MIQREDVAIFGTCWYPVARFLQEFGRSDGVQLLIGDSRKLDSKSVLRDWIYHATYEIDKITIRRTYLCILIQAAGLKF